jgi:hypothetical protein
MFFKQMINIPVNKKNEGILFVGGGIPSSRPLHIYRKTGAHCVTTKGTCMIADKPLKMLGKNKNGMFIPPDRCRHLTQAPYYSEYNNYVHRKCWPSMVPMYTVRNLNNNRFKTQGGVSESAFVQLKKYEAIIKNNQSSFRTYKTILKYSEDPVYTLKNDIAVVQDQTCYENPNYSASIP